MAANIITTEDLQNFKIELLEAIRLILSEQHPAPFKKWLKSHEVRELLTISPGTLQHLRVSGKLPFTKVGGVLYYAYEDIQKMLEDHRQNQPNDSDQHT
jgi:hypothetical protein